MHRVNFLHWFWNHLARFYFILSEVLLWVKPTKRIHWKQIALNSLWTNRSTRNSTWIVKDDVILHSCSSFEVHIQWNRIKAANSSLRVCGERSDADEALFGCCGQIMVQIIYTREKWLLIAPYDLTHLCKVNVVTMIELPSIGSLRFRTDFWDRYRANIVTCNIVTRYKGTYGDFGERLWLFSRSFIIHG